MIGHWREILYPIGYISSIAFGSRFLVQWIKSEIKKESVVPAIFWKLSLVGNIALMIHSFIQVQYPICLIQSLNAIISWRNLNLMQPKEFQVRKQTVIAMFAGAFCLTLFTFLVQGMFLPEGQSQWMRIPVSFLQKKHQSVNFLWHLMGYTGVILFNSRFWVQWWLAEKNQKSALGKPFWWLSLIGDPLSLAYFIRIGDDVNLVGALFGLVPYVRNLMLMKKKPVVQEQT